MQAISDIFDQGKQVLSPFFKGPLSIMTGGVGGSGKASTEVVKKAQETSIVKNSISNNMFSFNRQFVRLAGLSGAIAVGLGAYGSHVVMMKNDIPEEQKNSFRTASMYHFFGTFGMVASSLSRYPTVMTIADISIAATLSTLNLVQSVDQKRFPLLSAWFNNMRAYPFYMHGNVPGLQKLRAILQSGVLMAVGTTIFCGACYYYGLTGDASARKIAPFGGTTLIVAWLSLIL